MAIHSTIDLDDDSEVLLQDFVKTLLRLLDKSEVCIRSAIQRVSISQLFDLLERWKHDALEERPPHKGVLAVMLEPIVPFLIDYGRETRHLPMLAALEAGRRAAFGEDVPKETVAHELQQWLRELYRGTFLFEETSVSKMQVFFSALGATLADKKEGMQ